MLFAICYLLCAICLLLIAYCLLLIAYCLLIIAYCWAKIVLFFNLDKFEDYLHKQKVNLPRVDLVIKCQNILKAKKNHGKYGTKSCVSWRIKDHKIDREDLIIDGEYQEVVDETA